MPVSPSSLIAFALILLVVLGSPPFVDGKGGGGGGHGGGHSRGSHSSSRLSHGGSGAPHGGGSHHEGISPSHDGRGSEKIASSHSAEHQTVASRAPHGQRDEVHDVPRDKHGRIERSEAAKREFMKETGYPNGRPGYVVDHIVPLAKGERDDRSNLRWETKAQTRWRGLGGAALTTGALSGIQQAR